MKIGLLHWSDFRNKIFGSDQDCIAQENVCFFIKIGINFQGNYKLKLVLSNPYFNLVTHPSSLNLHPSTHFFHNECCGPGEKALENFPSCPQGANGDIRTEKEEHHNSLIGEAITLEKLSQHVPECIIGDVYFNLNVQVGNKNIINWISEWLNEYSPFATSNCLRDSHGVGYDDST